MKELYFWEGSAPVVGLMAVPIQAGAAFQAGTPQRIYTGSSGTTWDPNPDGKRFLIEQTTTFDGLRRRAPAKK
jgi:hypothetical protein